MGLATQRHSMSTVNTDQLPGNPPGLFGRQENNDISDVFWLTNSSQRDITDQSFLHLRRDISGLNRARGDDIHRNAEGAQLRSSTAAIRFECVLTSSVGDFPGTTPRAVSAYIDDPPPISITLDMPTSKFRHHQGRGTGIYGTMSVVACRIYG